jgi:hypothetical protein
MAASLNPGLACAVGKPDKFALNKLKKGEANYTRIAKKVKNLAPRDAGHSATLPVKRNLLAGK